MNHPNESSSWIERARLLFCFAAAPFLCVRAGAAEAQSHPDPLVKAERLLAENVSFSARLHPQFDYLESDLNHAGVPDPAIAKRDFLRRAFLGAKVTLTETLRVNYLTDLADRIIQNQVARLEWRPSDVNRFFFGYQKAPFGFEDTASSALVKPIERSASTRFWNEVVGIGSYHSGVYYMRDLGAGMASTFALTHNEKSQSDWPDVFSGDVSVYARLSKAGKSHFGGPFNYGLDLGYQPVDSGQEILGVSAFSNLNWSGYEFALEATTGSVDLSDADSANPFSWHAQVSRRTGETFEWVGRLSQVDTDGYQLKISSAIRKAPYSGFKYGKIDSLYLGCNYYVRGNDVKLSLGYELAQGRNALIGVGPLSEVRETVSGFRVRGQLMF